MQDIEMQAIEAELCRLCELAFKSIIIVPDVHIENISVRCLHSAHFDSSQEKTIFIVCVRTNDAAIVRGNSNPYKGSYKERVEGLLDFHAKRMFPHCKVHLEITGPSTGSVERLIPIEKLIRSGKLSDTSPIVVTARRFSIPDILIRGRHFIAPSPAIAAYLDHLIQNEPITTGLDLFGGTGLTAAILCAGGALTRMTVVERERAHLERMRNHVKDRRVEFVLADAFSYGLGRYDLVVADPYYEDAQAFLNQRLDTVLNSTRIFLFVPGNIEDLKWNDEIEDMLKATGRKVRRLDSFGQVLFDVRN